MVIGRCWIDYASQKKLTDSRTEEDYRKHCHSRSDPPASLKTIGAEVDWISVAEERFPLYGSDRRRGNGGQRGIFGDLDLFGFLAHNLQSYKKSLKGQIVMCEASGQRIC